MTPRSKAYRKADLAGSAAGALGWIRVAYFARSEAHVTESSARLAGLLAANLDDPETAVLLLAGYLTHQGYRRALDPTAPAQRSS